jgi:hypothetical protein
MINISNVDGVGFFCNSHIKGTSRACIEPLPNNLKTMGES